LSGWPSVTDSDVKRWASGSFIVAPLARLFGQSMALAGFSWGIPFEPFELAGHATSSRSNGQTVFATAGAQTAARL